MTPYLPPVVRFDQVRAVPIRWLWEPYLARGKLAVLDGDVGVGKSFFTVDLAARLSRCGRMPDGSRRRRKAAVLFLNAEDGLDDTLQPRLEAAGADLKRVFSLGGIRLEDPAGAAMSFPQHLDCLHRAVVAHEPELVVVDPMMAFFPPEVSANNDQTMRTALAPLAALAARSGTAVLLVRQLTKRGGRKALYRGLGSIGIIGAIRTGLFLARHPHERDKRVFAMSKSNIGPLAPTLAYRLVQHDGRAHLEWLGECDATADELCLPPARGEGPPLPTADEWLKAALADGPRPAKELLAAGAAAGFGVRTLERA
ncbi:MAG TPA: AAA family ATPase, partial [Gemmataceae bacterium]|nr:AAA family ATPase [Gemmataceae bacterium]